METKDLKEKSELEKPTEEPIFSETHIIKYYKVKLEVYLNGIGTGKGRYLSLFVQFLEGDFDDCLC